MVLLYSGGILRLQNGIIWASSWFHEEGQHYLCFSRGNESPPKSYGIKRWEEGKDSKWKRREREGQERINRFPTWQAQRQAPYMHDHNPSNNPIDLKSFPLYRKENQGSEEPNNLSRDIQNLKKIRGQ